MLTSTPGTTTDITTGQDPVIDTLRTVVTQAMLDSGQQNYATPLTTLAVDLAVAKADSNLAPFSGDGVGDACSGTGPTPTPAVWDSFNWNDGSTWQ
jgi:hypothetical protein